MPVQYDEHAEAAERAHELQRMAAIERNNESQRRHEEAKLKLQLQLKEKGKLAVSRTEATQRVVLAIVKVWTVPFALLLVWAYMRREREGGVVVPEFLKDYINL